MSNRIQSWLEPLATIAFILACGSVVWFVFRSERPTDVRTGKPTAATRAQASIPTQPVSISGAATKGNPKATTAIIEFSDFQCPFCVRFAKSVLPELDREYIRPGLVLFVFKHLPLEAIHPTARTLALAGECARRQGRFWDIHDRIFSEPKAPDVVAMGQSADVGLDANVYSACLTSPPSDVIESDVKTAASLGISGTPTFLIGKIEGDKVRVTARLDGVKSIADFSRPLEQLLRK